MELAQEYVETDAHGTQRWYADAAHSILHRDNAPAVISAQGWESWYSMGKLHRTDGPAETFSDGTKMWYQDGLLHRIDGPACEYADGTQLWLVNGNYHRTTGPAVVYANGLQSYWLNGVPVNEDEYPQRVADLPGDMAAAAAHRMSQLLERYESRSPLDVLVDLLHYCRLADVEFEELLTAAQTFAHEEAAMPVQ